MPGFVRVPDQQDLGNIPFVSPFAVLIRVPRVVLDHGLPALETTHDPRISSAVSSPGFVLSIVLAQRSTVEIEISSAL